MNPVLRPLISPAVRFAERWVTGERERHRRHAAPLAAAERAALDPFYGSWILDPVRVRVVEGLDPPPGARAIERLGLSLPFELDRIAGIALVDTVLILEFVPQSRRLPLLFHEMVHVAQYHLLGVAGFVERYAEGWLESGRAYRAIPLEADAYALAARFAEAPGAAFDVVAEVERRLGRPAPPSSRPPTR